MEDSARSNNWALFAFALIFSIGGQYALAFILSSIENQALINIDTYLGFHFFAGYPQSFLLLLQAFLLALALTKTSHKFILALIGIPAILFSAFLTVTFSMLAGCALYGDCL